MPQAPQHALQSASQNTPRHAPQRGLLTKDVLATQLNKLADEPRITPRAAELRALAHDLQHGTHLDQWAEVDLVHSFVRPESLAPASSGGGAGRLRALVDYLRTTGPRNRSFTGIVRWLRDGLRQQPVRDGALEAMMGVLVFIPLLVTWIGLREAVGAYGELSKVDRKEAARPFLQLWQSGFGGHLSPIGRFENVALATVVFITLLVLLAIWQARARARAERQETERHEADEHLLGSLAALLTQAQFALVPHRAAGPQQFARELTGAAKRLGSLAAQAEASHKALTTTGTLIKQATDDLQAAARGLTAEIPKIGGVASRLETVVRSGQEAIVRAGKENTAAADGIAERIKAAGATVESALGTLATAQQALVAKSETVAQASERASQALLASTARTNEAVDGMRDATERWDAVAAHWQDAAARLDSGIRTLTGSRNGLHGGDDAGTPAFDAPADGYGHHGTPADGDDHQRTPADAYGQPGTPAANAPTVDYGHYRAPAGVDSGYGYGYDRAPGADPDHPVTSPNGAGSGHAGTPAPAPAPAPASAPAPAPAPAPTSAPAHAPAPGTPQVPAHGPGFGHVPPGSGPGTTVPLLPDPGTPQPDPSPPQPSQPPTVPGSGSGTGTDGTQP
ncbi:hypothetical protein [Streptomyces odontomachi]|uniref:hypothetical protein n=1 Tax=Streptomyces odontomachi TaxID=2944940 RepID=UPI00210AD4C2|nr:hypothetical protein [Streptomyces sp. ODS25]